MLARPRSHSLRRRVAAALVCCPALLISTACAVDVPTVIDTSVETGAERAALRPPAPGPTVVDATNNAAVAIPIGFTQYASLNYRVAMPSSWTVVATPDELNDLLTAGSEASGIPAEALDQYRVMIDRGNAVVGLAANGDNFNAFGEPGNAAGLSDSAIFEAQYEVELRRFAENVTVRVTPRLFGNLNGLFVAGTYDLLGDRVHLYQFATADDDTIYYFTVTLFSGPDQDLADAIFSSIIFN